MSDAAIRVEALSKSYIVWSSPFARVRGPLMGWIGRLPTLDIAHYPTSTIADLQTCLGRATAVVTADTFPAHLATALDRPVAVLATGIWPSVFGPCGDPVRQHWFTRKMACLGCGSRRIHAKPLCLWDVEPQTVADFLAPHLAA